MNNLKIYSIVIWWFFFICNAISEDIFFINHEKSIGASFDLTNNNQLSFVVKNFSKENVSFKSNIDHLIRTGLQGFPQGAAMQFRSSDKKLIHISDESENGWIHPNLYNSKLDFEIVGGKLINNLNNSFNDILISSGSSVSRPINLMSGMRLVYSELRSADEFRIMWKIMTKESGTMVSKEIVSNWFKCGSTLSELDE